MFGLFSRVRPEDINGLINKHDSLKNQDVSAILNYVITLYLKKRIAMTFLNFDGDMLLFQWGTYDWGQGEHFEIDLTRQTTPILIADSMRQLSVTFKYAPSQETSTLGKGSRWCSTPSEVPDFQSYIQSSSAFLWAVSNRPASIEVRLEQV